MSYLLSLSLSLLMAAPLQTLTTPQRIRAGQYVVGPEDKLSVTVVGAPEVSKVYTVDSDGMFDFPYVGRVRAGGQPVRKIEEELVALLKKKEIFSDPQVSIEVETFKSQKVYVVGSVANPGHFPLSGNMTVMDALLLAGSSTADAAPYVLINRRPPDAVTDGPVTRVEPGRQERVTVADMQLGRARDILLHDGDTIVVPEAEKFIVNGNVKNSGEYVITDDNLTLRRALAMAGGATDKGATNRIKITRIVNGKEVDIKNAKMTELIKPGDVIFVPNKRM